MAMSRLPEARSTVAREIAAIWPTMRRPSSSASPAAISTETPARSSEMRREVSVTESWIAVGTATVKMPATSP